MQTPKSEIAIRIAEGFIPPLGFVHRILSALNWIDPADFEGINFVFLFDEVPSTRKGKNREVDAAIQEGLRLFAAYNAQSPGRPAHIMLMTRNLYKPIPRLLQQSSALTLWIAENIAHEVGHHLLAERRFSLRTGPDGRTENEEEFADRYAESIIAKMKSGPRYKFGSLLLRLAAQSNYYQGARNWKKGKYQIAADYFYLATQLKRDHPEASYWFWKARERASEQSS